MEVAKTSSELSRGLSFREYLPENQGMLFVFDKDGYYSFWMKDMKFNLDIIWINSNGIVVHIEKNLPPCSLTCPSYQSQILARYVLEVNASLTDLIPIEDGTFIEINLQNN